VPAQLACTLKTNWLWLKNVATWVARCWCQKKAIEKLNAARFAADVMGVSSIELARTDAEAVNLITSDHDDNDKPFLTGECTSEGFYRFITVWTASKKFHTALAAESAV
jgi:isocitrate lyase